MTLITNEDHEWSRKSIHRPKMKSCKVKITINVGSFTEYKCFQLLRQLQLENWRKLKTETNCGNDNF